MHDTLFVLRIVYERERNELYLLLVRSDCRSPIFRIFPQIGTEQDWRVLVKCEQYFSPRCSYTRNDVECVTAREAASHDAATQYLQVSGRLNLTDLNVLEAMGNEQLQFLDLLLIYNLYHVLPASISPNFVFVLHTKSSDDLDELRRVFKYASLSVSATGRDVPVYILSSKTDYQAWRTARNAGLLCYEKPPLHRRCLMMCSALKLGEKCCPRATKTSSFLPAALSGATALVLKSMSETCVFPMRSCA